MRIISDTKLDYDDVLILPKRSTLASRKDVDLNRSFSFKHSKQKWYGVPIMAANMDTVANINAAVVFQQNKMFTCLHKFISLDDIMGAVRNKVLDPDHFAVTIGKDLNALEELESTAHHDYFKFINIDVANGYSEEFSNFVSRVRSKFPETTIIAGNVCTAEMTQELILSGADIVKIGIGPGSMCKTRLKAGVGMPQLSAVIECADAAHGLGARVIADGGCKTPADIAKGFGAGADFVMVGSMFAAHDENSKYDEDGKAIVYGMSSTEAMKKHYGTVNKYRTSEGRIVKLDGRGPLKGTIEDILGSLRSTCTYIGAESMKDICKCTTFIFVNNQMSRLHEAQTIGE